MGKAFGTVTRGDGDAPVDGVPEAEMRMVEGMCERTTAREVMGEGILEEVVVKIGLRQGSVLKPLLFMAVLDLISMKTAMKDAMK